MLKRKPSASPARNSPSKNPKPIIFLVFANDKTNPTQFLNALEPERTVLHRQLSKYQDKGWGLYHSAGSSDPKELKEDLTQHSDRLIIFHFAGHADGTELQLAAKSGDSVKLSDNSLLAFLSEEPHLKLVFLNACATRDHVERLLSIGIPAVIATNSSINDKEAKDFAEAFYAGLVAGKSLKVAFKGAQAVIKSAEKHERIYNAMKWKNILSGTSFPWGLHVQDEEILQWKLRPVETVHSGNQGGAMMQLLHSGTGDNIVISNMKVYGKKIEYEALKREIEDLKTLLKYVPESEREKRLNWESELNEKEQELIGFKEEVEALHHTFKGEEKAILDEQLGENWHEQVDTFFDRFEILKIEEDALSDEELDERKEYYDSYDREMKSLSPAQLFERQKKDSLYYLEKYRMNVRILKYLLQLLGFFSGKVDNNFDSDTVSALKSFQRRYTMGNVDGMFGQLTFQVMADKLRALEKD